MNKPAKTLLYHGTNKPITNGKLQTHADSEHYIYASDSQDFAVAYAVLKTEDYLVANPHRRDGYHPWLSKVKRWFSAAEREKHDQTSLTWIMFPEFPQKLAEQTESGRCIVAFVYKPERFMKRLTKSDPRIYLFEHTKDFEFLERSFEYGSTKSLDIDKCQERKVAGLHEAMQHGIQVYYINSDMLRKDSTGCRKFLETAYKEKRWDIQVGINNGKIRDKDMRDLDFHGLMAFLQEAEQKGIIVHANKQEGIRPINYETGCLEKSVRDMPSHAYDGLTQWQNKIRSEQLSPNPVIRL